MSTLPEQPRAVFFLGNAQRDLQGLTLIAYHLRRSFGFEVEFCSGEDALSTVLRFAPDVLVLDQIGISSRVQLARTVRVLGTKVVIVPSAGFMQDPEIELQRAGKYTGARALVDRHCVWGVYGQTALIEGGVASKEHIAITGVPRFDFYSEPYTQLALSKPEYLTRIGVHNSRAPLITWTTGTYFQRTHGWKNAYRRVLLGHRMTTTERNDIRDEQITYETLASLAAAIAAQRPAWNVVIKVHPCEITEPYERLAARYPNMHIARPDVSIRDSLLHTDVLMQRWSTTATEAWMLDKPVLEVVTREFRGTTRSDSLAGNHVVRSTAEAISAIENYLSGTPVPRHQLEARHSFIRRAYHAVDGRSALRCAQVIADAANADGKQRHQLRSAALHRWQQHQREQDRSLPNRVRDAAGISRTTSLRFWTAAFWRQAVAGTTPYVDRTQIDRFTQQIDAVHRNVMCNSSALTAETPAS